MVRLALKDFLVAGVEPPPHVLESIEVPEADWSHPRWPWLAVPQAELVAEVIRQIESIMNDARLVDLRTPGCQAYAVRRASCGACKPGSAAGLPRPVRLQLAVPPQARLGRRPDSSSQNSLCSTSNRTPCSGASRHACSATSFPDRQSGNCGPHGNASWRKSPRSGGNRNPNRFSASAASASVRPVSNSIRWTGDHGAISPNWYSAPRS